MKNYVAAIDGIPGIMPGTVKVPPPPEFVGDDENLTPQSYDKGINVSKGMVIPRHKRRMMQCDKKE